MEGYEQRAQQFSSTCLFLKINYTKLLHWSQGKKNKK